MHRMQAIFAILALLGWFAFVVAVCMWRERWPHP